MRNGMELDSSYEIISGVELKSAGETSFQLVDGDIDIIRDEGVEASKEAWEFLEKANRSLNDGESLYGLCRGFGVTMHPEDEDCQVYVSNGLHSDKPITLEFTDNRGTDVKMELTPFTKCNGVFLKVESEKDEKGKWNVVDRNVTFIDGEVLGNVLSLEMEPVEKVRVDEMTNGESFVSGRIGRYSAQSKHDFRKIASSIDILTQPGCVYLEGDKLTAYEKVRINTNGRECYFSYTEGNQPMFSQYDTGMLEVRDLELEERFQMNFKDSDPHSSIYKELTNTIEFVKKNDGKPFYTEGLSKPVNLYERICHERTVGDKKEFMEIFNRFNPEHAMLDVNKEKEEKKEKISLRPKKVVQEKNQGLDRVD